MLALTIQQPWAAAIAYGRKRIENRTWRTKYTGPILIHAAKTVRGRADREFIRGIDPDIPETAYTANRGEIIAVAMLERCVSRHALRSIFRGQAVHDGIPADVVEMYAEGPVCWMLSNVRRCVPVAARGRQTLWESGLEPIDEIPGGLILLGPTKERDDGREV